VDKEKSVQISDLYQVSEGASLQEIILRVDGGKVSKKKSKVVTKKSHKKSASKHHHHHHHHEEEEHHHHHDEEEHHHHHDSDDHMPCVDTIKAYQHEKVGAFSLEIGKEELHRIIFKALQFF
jgi:hypothetical protein